MPNDTLFDQLTDGVYATWSGDVTRWTSSNLEQYHHAQHVTEAYASELNFRFKIILSGYLVNSFDDLQLQLPHDASYITKRNGVREALQTLLAGMSPEEFNQTILVLLSIYREQLEKAKPENDMQDVAVRVDAINRYLAFTCIQVIEEGLEDGLEDLTPLKALFLQVGALRSEILPWISVGLRKRIFDEQLPEEEVQALIDSAMIFYRAMDKVYIQASPFDMDDMNRMSAIKQGLRQERLVWQGMYHADEPEKTLNNWVRYLKGNPLSRLVVSRMNDVIKQTMDTLSPDNKKRASLVIDMLLLRVHRKPYLVQGHDVAYVAEGGFLPLSAETFYAMLDEDYDATTARLRDYADTVPDVLRDIMFFIFRDKAYAQRHRALLEACVHPELTQAKYPVFALADEGQDSLLSFDIKTQYWIQLIDSGLLTETEFFADKANCRLFEGLSSTFATIPEGITSNPKRMKIFCHALTLYRATQLNADALNRTLTPLAFMQQPNIEYLETSGWAEDLLHVLLKDVAYPEGALTLDFQAVVRFLELEFTQPINYESEAQLGATIADSMAFDASHPHVNVMSQKKLLHVFFLLFKWHQQGMEEGTMAFPESLGLHMQTLCAPMLDAVVLPVVVGVPRWFPLQVQLRIAGVVNMLMFQSDMQHRLMASSLRVNARQQHCFFLGMYRAYCDQKQTTQAEHDFWLHADNLKALELEVAPVHAFVQATQASLQQHEQVVLSYHSGWWRWIGSILGYDKQESDMQMAHLAHVVYLLRVHDLRTREGCRAVQAGVQAVVSNQLFKRAFWKSSPYHDALVQLSQKLDGLEQAIQKQSTVRVDKLECEEEQEPTPQVRPANSSGFTYASSVINTMFSTCFGCCSKTEGVDDVQERRHINGMK